MPLGQVLSPEEVIRRLSAARRGAAKLVFTNGCFDLLHPGHIRCLEQARALGDVLLVAINGDRSVRELKGEGRPLVPQQERAEILASFAAVDYVVIFDAQTPRELIAEILPDVLVKGGDWGPEAIVGREEVERAGGYVTSAPLEPGYSTTAILERIRGTGPSAAQASDRPAEP